MSVTLLAAASAQAVSAAKSVAETKALTLAKGMGQEVADRSKDRVLRSLGYVMKNGCTCSADPHVHGGRVLLHRHDPKYFIGKNVALEMRGGAVLWVHVISAASSKALAGRDIEGIVYTFAIDDIAGIAVSSRSPKETKKKKRR